MGSAVVDASALFDYLFRSGRGAEVEAAITPAEADLHVPALCDIEIAGGLRRELWLREMSSADAVRTLTAYLDLPLTRHGHGPLLARVLQLRENFTPYDAAYVALAELLGAALLTTDRRLARAVRRHTGIEVLTAG